tara:strand:+ start:1793 stop:2041 length:249 start_codon:yes stop_codon:yes gene_type:complete
MDIKEGITKILCENSHDTGEGVLIDFNKIHDFKDEIDALFTLHFVSKQRELLIAFKDNWNMNNDTRQEEVTDDDVDDYLSNL